VARVGSLPALCLGSEGHTSAQISPNSIGGYMPRSLVSCRDPVSSGDNGGCARYLLLFHPSTRFRLPSEALVLTCIQMAESLSEVDLREWKSNITYMLDSTINRQGFVVFSHLSLDFEIVHDVL